MKKLKKHTLIRETLGSLEVAGISLLDGISTDSPINPCNQTQSINGDCALAAPGTLALFKLNDV